MTLVLLLEGRSIMAEVWNDEMQFSGERTSPVPITGVCVNRSRG